jgi:hypothetical protein
MFLKFLSGYIILYNKDKNEYALATAGFSYTLLLSIIAFPSLIPFFRKDYKNMLFLWILFWLISTLIIISPKLYLIYYIFYYLSLFYIAFVYNKWYLQSLVSQNYKFVDASLIKNLIEDNFNNNKTNFIKRNLSEQEIISATNNLEEELYLELSQNAIKLHMVKSLFIKRFTLTALLFILFLGLIVYSYLSVLSTLKV